MKGYTLGETRSNKAQVGQSSTSKSPESNENNGRREQQAEPEIGTLSELAQLFGAEFVIFTHSTHFFKNRMPIKQHLEGNPILSISICLFRMIVKVLLNYRSLQIQRDKLTKITKPQRMLTFATSNQEFIQTAKDNDQRSSNDIHLAFMSASPLIYQVSDYRYFEGLPPMSFREEYDEILNGLGKLNISLRYRYQIANETSIKGILAERPIGLHLTCYGFLNTLENFRNDQPAYESHKNKGDYLLLEQQNGLSLNLYQQNIRKILDNFSAAPLKFVLISSQFQNCGSIFLNAGVEHVIHMTKTKALIDRAAILFSRTFYTSVFTTDSPICEAFDMAIATIKSKFGQKESQKFTLLTQDGHQCGINSISTNIGQGKIQSLDEIPQIIRVPQKVQPFMFRNTDMIDVLKYLSNQKIKVVQIFGVPGIGKSSFLKALSNYVSDRNFYPGGLLYVDLNKIETLKDGIDSIIAVMKNQDLSNQLQKHYSNNSSNKSNDIGLEQLLSNALNSFKNRFLLVLDNIEFISNDGKRFVSIINRIQQTNNNFSLIYSSYYYIEGLQNFRLKKLAPLTKEQSVQLLLEKFPYYNLADSLTNFTQIMELNEYTTDLALEDKLPSEYLNLKYCQMKHFHKEACVVSYLTKHPLFDVLEGHPMIISLISPLLNTLSLKDLFHQMIESHLVSFVDEKPKREDDLIQCLEFAIQQWAHKDHQMLELFYMCSIQKEGLSSEEINNIQEYQGFKEQPKRLFNLESSSLVYFDKMNGKYKTTQFMNQYVLQKLDMESLDKLHNIIVRVQQSDILSQNPRQTQWSQSKNIFQGRRKQNGNNTQMPSRERSLKEINMISPISGMKIGSNKLFEEGEKTLIGSEKSLNAPGSDTNRISQLDVFNDAYQRDKSPRPKSKLPYVKKSKKQYPTKFVDLTSISDPLQGKSKMTQSYSNLPGKSFNIGSPAGVFDDITQTSFDLREIDFFTTEDDFTQTIQADLSQNLKIIENLKNLPKINVDQQQQNESQSTAAKARTRSPSPFGKSQNQSPISGDSPKNQMPVTQFQTNQKAASNLLKQQQMISPTGSYSSVQAKGLQKLSLQEETKQHPFSKQTSLRSQQSSQSKHQLQHYASVVSIIETLNEMDSKMIEGYQRAIVANPNDQNTLLQINSAYKELEKKKTKCLLQANLIMLQVYAFWTQNNFDQCFPLIAKAAEIFQSIKCQLGLAIAQLFIAQPRFYNKVRNQFQHNALQYIKENVAREQLEKEALPIFQKCRFQFGIEQAQAILNKNESFGSQKLTDLSQMLLIIIKANTLPMFKEEQINNSSSMQVSGNKLSVRSSMQSLKQKK